MDSPETWRWIWLGAAVVFTVGEMASAGSFFLLPFAIGAALAAVLAFAGVALGIEWLVFVAASLVGVFALRPLAQRLATDEVGVGVGAKRWLGQTAVVLRDIPAGPGETGLVRLGREEWRAESRDASAIPEGTTVRVLEVTGTRVVVWPTSRLDREPAPEIDAGPTDGRDAR